MAACPRQHLGGFACSFLQRAADPQRVTGLTRDLTIAGEVLGVLTGAGEKLTHIFPAEISEDCGARVNAPCPVTIQSLSAFSKLP